MGDKCILTLCNVEKRIRPHAKTAAGDAFGSTAAAVPFGVDFY